MSPGRGRLATSRWGPYALAGLLILADFLWLARGLSHAHPGYRSWALNHTLYTDIIQLNVDHYLRGSQVIHPLPYLHDRIEYPVLLGFSLWLPSWLPAGPASWFAAAGVMTAAATFGSIALIRQQDPPAAWWLAASPALLLDAGINWDLVGILFLVGGVVWFGEGRYRLSGAATAIGTFFKLFPVVVAPLAVAALGARWWRSLATTRRPDARGPDPGEEAVPTGGVALARWFIPFLVISVVVMVPFLVAAPSNTLWFFRFNSLRPLKDSIWLVPQYALSASVVSNQAINTLSFLVVVMALAYGAWMVWRIPDAGQARAVALAAAMVIIVWMAVNKIWNPQYVLWVFAAGALASFPARFGVALGAISVYDYCFEFVLRVPDQSNSFAWVGYISIGARTLLFVLMVAWAIRELRRLVDVPDLVMAEDGVHTPA